MNAAEHSGLDTHVCVRRFFCTHDDRSIFFTRLIITADFARRVSFWILYVPPPVSARRKML